MLSNTHIRTLRLSLRPVSVADRPLLVGPESDPEVMRYLNGGVQVPEEGCPEADFLTPRGTEPELLVAHESATGRFIGWFTLFDDGQIDDLRTGEVGYRLRREAWGQGFATEGICAVVLQAFQQLGFDRVRAQTMTVNRASRRVLDKAGFHWIGTVYPPCLLPIPGGEQGEAIYERRRERVHETERYIP